MTSECGASQKGSTKPDDAEYAPPNPGLHRGKCSICRHPQREEIEQEFLDWTSAREIARTYGLASHTTVYRHARALRLFEHRLRYLRFALDRIIEHVGEVEPSAGNVIAAIALMAKINEQGEWAPSSRLRGLLRAPSESISDRIEAQE